MLIAVMINEPFRCNLLHYFREYLDIILRKSLKEAVARLDEERVVSQARNHSYETAVLTVGRLHPTPKFDGMSFS